MVGQHGNPVNLRVYDLDTMWIEIKGFEGKYQVNENGEIRSMRRHVENGSPSGMILPEKILKQQKNPDGYMMVSLRKDGKTYAKYVHRLVAEAFLCPTEERCTVNHIDGDKTNNLLNNLEFSSYSENNQHAYDIGLHSRKKHRLTESDVRKIRRECRFKSRRTVAAEFGTSRTNIDNIVTGKTWKSVK